MKLKSIGALLLSGVMMFAACDKYDDTALTGRVDDLEGRVTELEKLVADLNTTVSGLSTIVSAMENEDRIQSIVPLKEGETVIGYEITFSKSGKIQILNGKAPSLGVKDEGGILYWTVNGEFLLDSSSNKIPATIAPEFRVENGELQYRINGGEWQTMPGSANIGLIKKVQDGAESVTFILSDGTEITIPKVQSFALELDVEDIEIGIMPGQRMSIDYTVISGDENTLVKAISEGGYTVIVNSTDATKGYLSITAPVELPATATILVVAVNGKGEMTGKILSFENGELTLVNDAVTIGKNGGEFTVSIRTNMTYSVQIDPGSIWISQVVETKALRTDELTFTAEPYEETGSRTGTIDIMYGDGQKVTYTVVQTDEVMANGGEADFGTFKSEPSLTNFVDDQTSNGWTASHCAIISETQWRDWSSPNEKNPLLSGRLSSPGTVTSPVLEGGCGTLTFVYGTTLNPNLIPQGLKFKVEIKNESGSEIITKEYSRAKADVAMKTEYTESIEVNHSGKFTVVFTNLCPQQLDTRNNLDMVAITSVSWTGRSE